MTKEDIKKLRVGDRLVFPTITWEIHSLGSRPQLCCIAGLRTTGIIETFSDYSHFEGWASRESLDKVKPRPLRVGDIIDSEMRARQLQVGTVLEHRDYKTHQKLFARVEKIEDGRIHFRWTTKDDRDGWSTTWPLVNFNRNDRLEVLSLPETLGQHYPELKKEMIVAGCRVALQDNGKARDFATVLEVTDEGWVIRWDNLSGPKWTDPVTLSLEDWELRRFGIVNSVDLIQRETIERYQRELAQSEDRVAKLRNAVREFGSLRQLAKSRIQDATARFNDTFDSQQSRVDEMFDALSKL